jgi:AraC-like DNA-binding protein
MNPANRSEPPIIRNPDLLRRGEPFVQALRALRLTGVLASTVAIGTGPWATSMPHPGDCIVLYFLTKGNCVAGTLEPREFVELREFDALLLPHPGRYMLADDSSRKPVPLEELLERELGRIDSVEEKWKSLFASPFNHHIGKGEPTAVGLIAMRLFFDQSLPTAILEGLPSLVHLNGIMSRDRSFVETLLTQIIDQGEKGLAGQDTATRLAEALLVHCLSQFLIAFGEDRPGFLRGLKDPYLARVIGAVQNRPDSRWTLEQMARSAGLSRSGFAGRFRATLGMTPSQFVTAVRMARAADLLLHGQTPMVRIAELTGYGSEAAFSRAFRKWSGSPPGALRRSAPIATESPDSWTSNHLKQLLG